MLIFEDRDEFIEKMKNSIYVAATSMNPYDAYNAKVDPYSFDVCFTGTCKKFIKLLNNDDYYFVIGYDTTEISETIGYVVIPTILKKFFVCKYYCSEEIGMKLDCSCVDEAVLENVKAQAEKSCIMDGCCRGAEYPMEPHYWCKIFDLVQGQEIFQLRKVKMM